MATRNYRERLAISVVVPIGEEGLWRIIRELDAEGPWRIADVDARSRVNKGTVSDYVKRLRLGGYVQAVGEREHPRPWFGPATTYRIARQSKDAPRLGKAGEVLPEPLIEVLWRTMKMVKTFTTTELIKLVETPERPINARTVRGYVIRLARVGVIGRVGGTGRGSEVRYRLLRALGAKAPKILQSHIIFDPNSGEVIGEASAVEVNP